MIIITKNKSHKKYKIPEMPNLPNARLKIVWLNRQKMLATVSNIKSVSVQVRDIKKMIYSTNSRLIALYSKFCLQNRNLDDNAYITISKTSDLNRTLIYALISEDWLINVDDLNNKSQEELENECQNLQENISVLKSKKNENTKSSELTRKIRLLEYKLSCLLEHTLNPVTLGNESSKMVM